jgi:phage terminase large subunit GpA-like protein
MSELFFNTLEELMLQAAESVRPPERMTVSEAAEKYRFLNNPGSYVGPWKNSMTPYLVEPMDVLTSHEYEGMVLVSSAQSGKTDVFVNYLLHSVICDPADMMLIQTAQATARDFSLRRVDRLFRHSKEVGKRLLPGRDSDNVFDKRFASGMILTLSWPSVNELSGRPIPRLWLTDYDRMTQDVDGEGTPYALAKARATTFRSHGMVVAESSPGFVISDPHWVQKTAHEAPPTEGILALYNSGDRRRWYWRCVSCKNAFEPSWLNLKYPTTEDPHEAGDAAVMVCPHCGQIYSQEDSEVPGKHEMNQLFSRGGHAAWLKDGQRWDQSGEIVGDGPRTKIASFWVQGVAAVFNDWAGLVSSYLLAEKEWEDTGSEQTLKTVVNTKLGLPYLPKAQSTSRVPETLRSRANDYGKRIVPWGVRFLIASVDVQKNRFVVQVHGIGEAKDVWVIDRFEVKYSRRKQSDRDDQLCFVNPGAYPEDWKLLVYEVMQKTYPLMDGTGREMAIKMTFCDSGGREGVTQNAYNFVRWLRCGYDNQALPEEGSAQTYPWVEGLYARFQLIKGDSNVGAPRVRLAFPDSQRKDRHAGARGEIPVMFINTNVMKNALDKMLDRTDPGGRINFPNWLDTNFYKELVVEIKNKEGKWENPNGYRNESWDLLVYCLAGCLHPSIRLEHLDWSRPPTWACEWEKNDLVFDPRAGNKPFEKEKKNEYDLDKLAELLA